jgi:hypothetical protein
LLKWATLETWAASSNDFIDGKTYPNPEPIPFENAIRKNFKSGDINFGKNTVKPGWLIREVVYADAVNADIDFVDVKTFDENAIYDSLDDIILEFVVRQSRRQALRKLFVVNWHSHLLV